MQRFRVCALLCVIAAMIAGPVRAQAPVSADELVQKLQNRTPATRSFDPAKAEARERKRVVIEETRRKAETGTLTPEDRGALSRAIRVEAAGTVDLEIFFDFDSAVITPASVPQLTALGQALTADALASQSFLIGGHTDGKGEADYNVALSQRRAAAVKAFLAERFKIAPPRLISVGFGEEQLKNTADPLAGENRRVQIVNVTQ
jgi:outer membrane protein OmpA-like peptidoglycan-associated protein